MSEIDLTDSKPLIKGHTTFELVLSAYIILAIMVACALLVMTHNEITNLGSSNYAPVTKQGSKSSNKPKTDPAPTKYVGQTFTGHDFKVSLTFDPNAYGIINYTLGQKGADGTIITGSGNDEVDVIGNPIDSTNKIIIAVSTSTEGLLSPTNTSLDLRPVFNASIMGNSYTVYTEYNPNIPNLIVNVRAGEAWYQVKLMNYIRGGAIESTPISTSVEKSILQSLEIKPS